MIALDTNVLVRYVVRDEPRWWSVRNWPGRR